ncbi:MAG: hypothetical protein LKM36_10555 [Flavobacteriales bacterium]|nr:hypothetical protein [Flavobacteriales bacterium]
MGISGAGSGCEREPVAVQREQAGADPLRLGAVKGVGEARWTPSSTSAERTRDRSPAHLDLMRRVNLRSANRKALESLAYAGAFDGFPKSPRAHFSSTSGEGKPTFMETWSATANSTRTARTVHR